MEIHGKSKSAEIIIQLDISSGWWRKSKKITTL